MKKEMSVQMINPGSGLNIGFSLQRFSFRVIGTSFSDPIAPERLDESPSFKIKNS
jgi:hypothetical protein